MATLLVTMVTGPEPGPFRSVSDQNWKTNVSCLLSCVSELMDNVSSSRTNQIPKSKSEFLHMGSGGGDRGEQGGDRGGRLEDEDRGQK